MCKNVLSHHVATLKKAMKGYFHFCVRQSHGLGHYVIQVATRCYSLDQTSTDLVATQTVC